MKSRRRKPATLSRAVPSITYSRKRSIPITSILELYEANQWSSAQKPVQLRKALANSHSLISAWHGKRLVGLGNAISDGHLVVYYSHLLVHPEYHGRGVGSALMTRLMKKYGKFHQQILVADGRAIDFYKKCGFTRAGKTQPMWVYAGADHS
jgi:GNAT superfamily N-acetyltransferase